jgi:predicted AlkP superfamily pyrophosphatase or phosphodiesterase
MNHNKTIFVLLDGCGFDVAECCLGYPEHLIEKKQGAKYRVIGELPSSSRPIYETLFTGLPPYLHGVVGNLHPFRSGKESVFDLCGKKGLITAAAAYYWMSELYVASPFNPARNRFSLESDSAIHHGIFYFEDHYPDSHVFSDAEFLRACYSPDLLLIHTMNGDETGHRFGYHSKEHHLAINRINEILAMAMPHWLNAGYQVVITADHGMNELGLHGGNTHLQRTVPLYLFSPKLKAGDFSKITLSQLTIAPLLCALLGIDSLEGMVALKDLEVDLFA